MTYGKRQYESLDHVIRQAITPLYTITQELMILIDSDTQAFNKYMVCLVCVLLQNNAVQFSNCIIVYYFVFNYSVVM